MQFRFKQVGHHSELANKVEGHPGFFVVLMVVIIFSIPRVIHPVLPYGLSGLDLALPLLVGWLIFRLFSVGSIAAPSGLLLVFSIWPLFMGCMALASLAVVGDTAIMKEGLLQALRRCSPGLLAVCLAQGRLSTCQSQVLMVSLIGTFLLGAVLFYSVEYYEPLGLTNPSRLSGNFASLTMDIDSAEGDESLLGADVRLAGNAGSQTIFGVLCGIGIVIALELVRTYHRLFIFSLLSYAFLWAALVASSAKAAIVATALTQVWLLTRNSRMIIVLGISGAVAFAVGGAEILTLASEIESRGENSWSSRVEKYQRAWQFAEENPLFLLLGHGFKGLGVGWHSEIVETLMGYGVLLGALVLFVIFAYLPIRMTCDSDERKLVSKSGMLAIWTILGVCALFQDVVQDANTLLVLVLIVGVQRQYFATAVVPRVVSRSQREMLRGVRRSRIVNAPKI